MVAGVYLIINKINGHMYVGGTVDIYRRILEHKRGANADTQAIDRTILKYGKENFIYQVITELPADWDIIGEHEKYWIKFYNTFENRNYYNMTEGGEGSTGYKKPFEDFKYTVIKSGKRGFTIRNRLDNHIKTCKDKSKLEPIAEALNNGEITEEEAKLINLNPFKYTIVKAGKKGFSIFDRSHKRIKTCKDKSKLEPIVEALNNGKITEEEVRSIKGVDKVLKMLN